MVNSGLFLWVTAMSLQPFVAMVCASTVTPCLWLQQTFDSQYTVSSSSYPSNQPFSFGFRFMGTFYRNVAPTTLGDMLRVQIDHALIKGELLEMLRQSKKLTPIAVLLTLPHAVSFLDTDDKSVYKLSGL